MLASTETTPEPAQRHPRAWSTQSESLPAPASLPPTRFTDGPAYLGLPARRRRAPHNVHLLGGDLAPDRLGVPHLRCRGELLGVVDEEAR